MQDVISHGHLRCKELSPHKNRGMEITYVEQGMLEWVVEGVPERVEAGSVFFTLPWQVHGSLHPKEPDNAIWHVLFRLNEEYPSPREAFDFPPRFGFAREEMRLLSRALCASTRHSFKATAALRWLIPAVVRELQSEHELGEPHALSLLRAIVVELKRVVTGEASDAGAHSWSEGRVQALLGELSANCGQPWTLERMAAHCGIKRTRLTALFQQLTGGTPIAHLTRLRLEHGKTLLRETELKVIDVAFECGYGSSQYFANSFKRGVGMTPSQYRAHCALLSREELRHWSDVGFRSPQEEQQRIAAFNAD